MAAAKHAWVFKGRLRGGAFGWRASRLACQRLKEAATEIKGVVKHDPVTAADGVVTLLERIWPAFEHIDTSSGALGGAVYQTQIALLPIVVNAPASRKVRDAWLDRLWEAIQEDGVDYLAPVEDFWGDLCASPDTASWWADEFLGKIRDTWSGARPYAYVRGTCLCLSSLVAADRLQDMLDLLALARFPFWQHRKFAVRALAAAGRTEEALAYAEASRGLNEPNGAIDAACEKILLDAGRAGEAYAKYGLTANSFGTGLATFRRIVAKYPDRKAEEILKDLVRNSNEPDCGLRPQRTQAFSISRSNLPPRGARIRKRSNARRVILSMLMRALPSWPAGLPLRGYSKATATSQRPPMHSKRSRILWLPLSGLVCRRRRARRFTTWRARLDQRRPQESARRCCAGVRAIR